MIRLFAVAAFVVVALPSYAQTGDPFQDALIAGLDRGAEQAAAKIMGDFRQVVPASDRKIIDRLRIVINRNDLRILNVGTDGRTIQISAGFLVYTTPVSVALAYEMAEGLRKNASPDTDRVIAYARYYVDGKLAQQAAFARGQTATPLKNYFVWTGMSAAKAQETFAALNKDTIYQQTFNAVLHSSLAFVLAHELGHNVLDQFDPENNFRLRRPPNPEDETAADAYGFKILIRAGYSPFLAIGVFMFLDPFERGPTGAPMSSDHPPALCRWARAMIAGWNGIRDDASVWEKVRAQGGEADMKKLEGLVRTAEDQVSTLCPGNTAGNDVCALVERFLVGAPDAFTADRGELRRLNQWRSKSRLPNSSCHQEQNDRAYTFSCIINSGSNSAKPQGYYDQVRPQLAACLDKLSRGFPWKVTSSSTNDLSQKSNGVSYFRSSPAGTFEIDFDTTTDLDDGDSYNYLRIDYEPQ
jgi:hypothetical protein